MSSDAAAAIEAFRDENLRLLDTVSQLTVPGAPDPRVVDLKAEISRVEPRPMAGAERRLHPEPSAEQARKRP